MCMYTCIYLIQAEKLTQDNLAFGQLSMLEIHVTLGKWVNLNILLSTLQD